MSLEDVIMGGIVFKGKKEGLKKDENKVKIKVKKIIYIKGIYGFGVVKMKVEIWRKRVNRYKW